jgi:hypothetical protein
MVVVLNNIDFKFGAQQTFPFGKYPDPHHGDVKKHRVL